MCVRGLESEIVRLMFLLLFMLPIQAATSTMDGIIDSVSAPHALPPLIALLKTNGKLVLVGAPEKPLELPVFPLLMGEHKTLST